MALRVLVVDDSSFMRSILGRLIGKDARFEVVGMAANGAEALEQIPLLSPDVVTMDIEMPVMDGLTALERIMATHPRPVVMLSSLTEAGAEATLKALELGAVDFLPKALDDGGRSVFSNFHVLADKIFAAAQVRLGGLVKQAETADVLPAVAAHVAPAPIMQPVAVGQRPKIVLVGSSTGGPRALNQLIAALPKLSVPMVIAQHMPEGFTTTMARRLNELGVAEVVELEQGMEIVSGRVHVCPGGKHTKLARQADGKVVADLLADEQDSLFKPSVDVLAASAQVAYGKEICAVMLTGMGNDGAAAYAAIKTAGGRVIVQDEASCVVYGMPKAVVEMDGASEVLPLDKIAGRVGALAS